MLVRQIGCLRTCLVLAQHHNVCSSENLIRFISPWREYSVAGQFDSMLF